MWVYWESMGSDSPHPVTHLGAVMKDQYGNAQTRFPRYPRAFRCLLDNPNDLTGDSIEYELYDIGAQRHLKPDSGHEFCLRLTGQRNARVFYTHSGDEIQPNANGEYQIPGLDEGSGAQNSVTLKFWGDHCLLRVFRPPNTKMTKNGDGSDDGSPPPADPGDDSNEAQSLFAEVKALKLRLMEQR